MEIGVFFFILLGCVILNCLFYLYISKTNTYTSTDDDQQSGPVSVIVCAKNEAENLKELVPQLLSQDHPNFEIILINDASSDDTGYVIEEFVQTHANVHLVNVVNNEAFWGNKKYALTLGIKKAVHNHLIFIDADCRPASHEWLRLMSCPLGAGSSISLGYGGYKKIKNSFLNALIRFETVMTAMHYFGFALRGNPFMGVGRNLGYTSQQFYEVRGFMSHMNIMGGDDDLFVNEASTGNNTAVVLNSKAFTISEPKKTWKSWWTQKKRHVSTAKHYKFKHKLALGLFHSSQIFFLMSAVVGLVFSTSWLWILGLILIRYLVVVLVIGKGMVRFRESELIPMIPFLELMLMSCHLGLLFSNATQQPKRWK